MGTPINDMTDRELLEGAYSEATRTRADIFKLTIQVSRMAARIGDLEFDLWREVRRLDHRIDELKQIVDAGVAK